MTTAAQRLATGRYGEESAARWLCGQGMVLLDHNWRCELGEIDLVLRDGEVLVVCEVKTRASAAYGSPVEAVTPAKLARLRRLAARWIADRGVRVAEVRFDLVGVRLDLAEHDRFDHVRGVG